MSELGNFNPLSAKSMQQVAMSSAEPSAGQAPSVGEALSEGEAPCEAACCDAVSIFSIPLAAHIFKFNHARQKDNVTRIRPVIPKNDDIWVHGQYSALVHFSPPSRTCY